VGLRRLLQTASYNGRNLAEALAKLGDWSIEAVKRRGGDRVSPLAAPMGCRTQTCWLNRNRLAKDFEASIANATIWIYIPSVQT
jgi:hypothetical protein